jgi:hypothetical protein
MIIPDQAILKRLRYQLDGLLPNSRIDDVIGVTSIGQPPNLHD